MSIKTFLGLYSAVWQEFWNTVLFGSYKSQWSSLFVGSLIDQKDSSVKTDPNISSDKL